MPRKILINKNHFQIVALFILILISYTKHGLCEARLLPLSSVALVKSRSDRKTGLLTINAAAPARSTNLPTVRTGGIKAALEQIDLFSFLATALAGAVSCSSTHSLLGELYTTSSLFFNLTH